jgi:hypothetical protein
MGLLVFALWAYDWPKGPVMPGKFEVSGLKGNPVHVVWNIT